MAEISPNPCTNDRIQETEEEQIPSKRQAIETLTDRLSELPDPLILHILHFLYSTKQAVRTSALSKRWRNLWTSVQSFDFVNYRDDNLVNFVKIITKVLFIQCMENVKINRFTIYFKLEERFETHLACWVLYLLGRGVEKLDIDLNNVSSGCHEFLLPNEIFTNWVLTKLRLGYCYFDPDRQIEWKVLRVLCISKSYVNEDLIENIMNGSPLLESLELDTCCGYNRLDITSASVKKLIFNGYGPKKDALGVYINPIVEVNAPHILSLNIIGMFLLLTVQLLDVSSLLEAKLDYVKLKHSYLSATWKDTKDEMLEGFIKRLYNVKNLTVGDFCSSSLMRLEAKGFRFPSNMKYPHVISHWYSSSDSENEEQGEPVVDDGPDGDEIEHGADGLEIGHGVDNE